MRITRPLPSLLASALLLTLAGCRYTPSWIPIAGGADDVAALAGEWEGEYASEATGRSGAIYFRLAAGRDTATGEVIMVAPRYAAPGNPQPGAVQPGAVQRGEVEGRPSRIWSNLSPTDQVLTIRFVEAEGGMVRGVLDAYRDPTCDCLLDTRFEGRIRSDTVEGTFTSRRRAGGDPQGGRWRVVRTKPR